MRLLTTQIASFLAIALLVGAAWAQPPGGGQGPPQGRGGGPGRGGPGGPQGEFRQMVPPLMLALDADRDGEISAEEIKNAAAALKKLDKNDDGKLTRDELRPQGGPGFGRPGAGGMVERLMAQDANKDGKVDKSELPEQMQRILERGDLNKDGAIDKEEAEKIAERFSQAGGGRGGRGGGQGRGGQGGGAGGGRPQRPE